MNPFKQSAFKAVVVLLFAAAASGAWAADPVSADSTALGNVAQAWANAYNQGDADAVTALYADDAVLMPPGAPAAQGKDAIHKFFVTDIAEAQHAGNKFLLTATPEATVVGDWGWVSGAYTVTDKDGHTVDNGKFLSVYRKVDGQWLFVRDSWSPDAAKK